MPYVLKGLAVQFLTGPSAGGKRIGIVCPQPDAPQGIVQTCFREEASAGGEPGILQGLVMRNVCISTTENDGFLLIF